MSGSFPYLAPDMYFSFPDPAKAPGGFIAAGGNLSPGMLVSAYLQGLFPWFNEGEPILWHSPDPRFVLFPEKLHVSQSMRKVLRQGVFEIRFDTDFPRVIRSCAETRRKGQRGTWITRDMIAAYSELHRLGFAHSAEAWQNGELAGGCYGVFLDSLRRPLDLGSVSGGVFFGESMFARKTNASKAAFITLARHLFDRGVAFIDCQVHTDHLASLGGEEISRQDYLRMLFAQLPETAPST
jgi:leucyl/phenylalanyl-tRNA--protein transferase